MARDPAARYQTPAAVVAALHPWAAPGPEFPARLFRPSSHSTAHDRRATDHEPARDPLPETLCIIRPKALRAAEPPAAAPAGAAAPARADDAANAPPLSPTEEFLAELASDTQGGGGGASPTDEFRALPRPADLWPVPLPVPRPVLARVVPPARLARARVPLRAVVGLVLAALALAAGVAALVFLTSR